MAAEEQISALGTADGGPAVMVALLYGLLGAFSPALLLLRLEETAIGAAVGTLVTVLVLPLRTRDLFGNVLADVLDALHRAVRAADEGGDAQAAARDLDRRIRSLSDAVGPVKRGWDALVPSRIRDALRIISPIGYLTREMAVDDGAQGRAGELLDEIAAARAAIGAARVDGHAPRSPSIGEEESSRIRGTARSTPPAPVRLEHSRGSPCLRPSGAERGMSEAIPRSFEDLCECRSPARG